MKMRLSKFQLLRLHCVCICTIIFCDIHNAGLSTKDDWTELKTLEWDILNPDRIVNLEIKNERRTSNI